MCQSWCRTLKGANDCEGLADENVMRPVDADVVHVVLAIVEPHDAVDDASWVGSERGFRRVFAAVPLTIVPEPRLQFAGI